MPRWSIVGSLALAVGIIVSVAPSIAREQQRSPTATAPAWQVVARGTAVGDLTAVEAVSSRDVWVVGSTHADSRPLIARWNGATLSRSVLPARLGHGSLQAVRARGARDVWAVGCLGDPGDLPWDLSPLALHWNGRAWARSPLALPATGCLNGVLPLAADDVWAVGYRGPDDQHALIVHFDGRRWSPARLPRLTGDPSELFAIDGLTARDIWAVGSVYAGFTLHERFDIALHWDGKSWRRDRRWTSAQALVALDVVTPSRIFAVSDVGGEGYSDVVQWNGRTLRRMRGTSTLTAVAAPTPTSVWVVGYTLAHWDGERWRDAERGFFQPLTGLSALTPRDVWGVGDSIVIRSDR